MGVTFLPLLDMLQRDGSQHVDDGVHLNDAGYEELARLLRDTLLNSGLQSS